MRHLIIYYLLLRHYMISKEKLNVHLRRSFITAYLTMIKYYTVLLLVDQNKFSSDTDRRLALKIHYTVDLPENTKYAGSLFTKNYINLETPLEQLINSSNWIACDRQVIDYFIAFDSFPNTWFDINSIIAEIEEHNFEFEN